MRFASGYNIDFASGSKRSINTLPISMAVTPSVKSLRDDGSRRRIKRGRAWELPYAEVERIANYPSARSRSKRHQPSTDHVLI